MAGLLRPPIIFPPFLGPNEKLLALGPAKQILILPVHSVPLAPLTPPLVSPLTPLIPLATPALAFPLPLLNLLHESSNKPFLPFPYLPLPLPLYPIFPIQINHRPTNSSKSSSLTIMKIRLFRLKYTTKHTFSLSQNINNVLSLYTYISLNNY